MPTRPCVSTRMFSIAHGHLSRNASGCGRWPHTMRRSAIFPCPRQPCHTMDQPGRKTTHESSHARRSSRLPPPRWSRGGVLSILRQRPAQAADDDRRSSSRATATSMSAARPRPSTARPMWSARCMSRSASRQKQTHPYPIVMVHGGTCRAQLHRHAGRPRRLGAVFRAPGLRGLCGRPARPRPLRLPRRGLRAAAQRRRATMRQRASCAGEIQALAAGASAHAVARQRRAGRSGDAADGRRATCRRSRISPSSRCSTATR